MHLGCLLLLSPLLQAMPHVQAPDAAWLTFTTTHYRIHCPRAFEAFGREVAGRIEGIHAQYLGLVGFAYEKPIDILILDPMLEANGIAFPVFQRPHVVLWKTAPEPDSVIGHNRGWAELLLTHELGHMHHLLRPGRTSNPLVHWLFGVGPITWKSPRWIVEGYATVIEGKLTGSGRPHSAIRASVLRQWALEGKLPAYEALNGTAGFLGSSMAYLGGSAYLEWLEAKASDPKALQILWTRLAGRRDFDAAFLATFGFSPKDGYQRFCAELTHTALELERRTKTEGLREGELVTQLRGWVTDLALSPDGTRLLARVLDPKKPGLYIWDLKAKPVTKPTPKDPGEPPDHAPLAPSLAPTHRLGWIHGALPWKPVWTSSSTVAYQVRLPDSEGVLKASPRQWSLGASATATSAAPSSSHPAWKEVDGIWNLVDGQGRTLTRTLAAAWNPVASPDGRWIYYTQLSASGLQIRKLDARLPPLEVRPLTRDPTPLVKDLVLPKADEPSPLPAPVPVESHPYKVAESQAIFPLFAATNAPSSHSYQIGVGGNDILGRLNWQAIAGLGNSAGPRGGMLGAAWRGWAWAPALQLFSTLEHPSRQETLAARGFDRERRGAELAFDREDLGRPGWRLRPVATVEQITLDVGGRSTRSLAGGTARLGNHWSQDGEGFQGSLAIQAYEGHTNNHSWAFSRLAFAAGWINPWVPLTLRWEIGRLGGEPTTFDRFHLGGVQTSLLPSSLDSNRVVQPALPAYTQVGNRLQGLRGDLRLGFVTAYLEQVTVWEDTAPRPSAQRIAGVEIDSHNLDLPLAVLRRFSGNLSFTLGIHRPMDGSMKNRTVGTFSVIVRP